MRLACVQYQMRRIKSFDDFATQVTYFVGVAADYRADFLLLPELVSAQLLSAEDALTAREGMRRSSAHRERFEALMRELAIKHGMTIVSGSLPVLDGSNEETVLICDVDLNALHSVRSGGTVTPRLDRRADLFRLVSLLADDQASSGPRDGPLGGPPGKS